MTNNAVTNNKFLYAEVLRNSVSSALFLMAGCPFGLHLLSGQSAILFLTEEVRRRNPALIYGYQQVRPTSDKV